MRLFAIVLFVLQWACSSPAFAMTPAEKDAQCRVLALGTWSYANDTEAEALARSYLDKAGLDYVPVVCLGLAPVGATAFAQGDVVQGKLQTYFFILINADMRLELFGELRGLVAHEVAHLRIPESRRCGQYYFERKFDMYTTCEHAVDALGETLGSKGDVRRALLFLSAYVQRIGLSNDSVGVTLLELLERRVRLLE